MTLRYAKVQKCTPIELNSSILLLSVCVFCRNQQLFVSVLAKSLKCYAFNFKVNVDIEGFNDQSQTL